jgi:small-conductance mechanosensitive channel
LLSAALGFALQRPITNVAAWIMIIFKRPFEIGDRIIITMSDEKIRGDVKDITLSHIYLEESGGTVQSDDNSGRIIIVPNHFLFEYSVINYTLQHDFILDEVITTVTYDSDLDLANKICLQAAKKVTKEFKKEVPKNQFIRNFFEPSGVNVHARYYVPARRRQEISSQITYEIFKAINKEKKVEIAYPHTEIVFKDKKLFHRRKK